MTRRSVPSIDPNDLRDHASHERVDRIWTRLESDLEVQGLFVSSEDGRADVKRARASGQARVRPLVLDGGDRRRRVLAALAMAAVFGGGVFVGRAMLGSPAERPVTVGSTADAAIDVYASGSQGRLFQLPNGGSIHLEPESTVEVAEIADSGMTLRLLRGSASIDNTHAAFGSVAVVAGEARLTAPAGGVMAVRRNERDVDVIVSGGTVDLEAPGVHQHLSSGDRLHAVPISTPTAVLDSRVHHAVDSDPLPPHALRVARDGHPERGPGEISPDAAPQASWYSKYRVGDDDGALKLLEQQGDMRSVILNAQSGAELAGLADLNVKRTDLWLIAAKRAVDEFPHDPKVVGLPMSLGNYYSSHGNEELAKKYFALAGAAGFADDVACRELRGADPSSAETADKARSYLAKYPDGNCRADAESLLDGLDPQRSDSPESPSEPKAPAAVPSPSAPPSASPSPPAASSAPAVPPPGSSSSSDKSAGAAAKAHPPTEKAQQDKAPAPKKAP